MSDKTAKKIMVVEDEQYLRELYVQILQQEGYVVDIAEDGEQALAKLTQNEYDLILLDVIMPKMNGLKMLQKLREDPWGKTVPVILLSNDDDPEHIRNALQDDVTDYLVKSDFELENIVKKIKEILII